MSPDRLEQFLLNADADASPPPKVEHQALADRVRRLHRQRKATTRAAIATSLVFVIALVIATPIWRSTNRSVVRRTTSAGMKESDRIMLASLDEDARRHTRVANMLLARERKPVISMTRGTVDPSLWLQRQRAEAAPALVRSADRIYSENQNPVAAAAAYRQAIRLFPDTPAAAMATERLERIPT